MKRPAQRDLFADEVARVHDAANLQTRLMGKRFEVDPVKIAAFEFRGDGPECVPDPNYVPPEWLRLPTDE